MGRSRYKIYEPTAPYFLTCTVINWIPIFTRPETVQIILDSFVYLQKERSLKLYAYVILENHLHWIAQTENLEKDLTSFKSYTAKMILNYLKEKRVERILQQLRFYKKEHKKDREYQVWEEGSHPQLLENNEMLLQKLDYIHFNPVKRGYVDRPEDWRYSSARNFAGQTGLIDIFQHWN
jgi:putative transposase